LPLRLGQYADRERNLAPMLVAYSDSEGEDEPAPVPTRAPPAPAATRPPARREVTISSLQRTGQLPVGFFEAAPEVEADAGGDVARLREPAPKPGSAGPRGLGAMLPPPSSAKAKGEFGSASDVLAALGRVGRPARRPAMELPAPSASLVRSSSSSASGIRVQTDMYGSGASGSSEGGAVGEEVTESYEAYSAGFAAGGVGCSGGGGVGPAPPPSYGGGATGEAAKQISISLLTLPPPYISHG